MSSPPADTHAALLARSLATLAAQMVPLPAGEVTLRDEAGQRNWTVALKPFSIGRFALTQAAYRLLSGLPPAEAQDQHKPVVEVSWLDAIAFCNRLSQQAGLAPCYDLGSDDGDEVVCDWSRNGYRLPSEAEWEYACRAGSAEVRHGELEDIAWFAGNAGGRLHAVGGKAPNAWGLHDMIGNAWEWCWDVYDARVYGPYRVFRGGGWSDPPRGCRASCRRKSHPTFRIDDLGFRLVRSAPAGHGA